MISKVVTSVFYVKTLKTPVKVGTPLDKFDVSHNEPWHLTVVFVLLIELLSLISGQSWIDSLGLLNIVVCERHLNSSIGGEAIRGRVFNPSLLRSARHCFLLLFVRLLDCEILIVSPRHSIPNRTRARLRFIN